MNPWRKQQPFSNKGSDFSMHEQEMDFVEQHGQSLTDLGVSIINLQEKFRTMRSLDEVYGDPEICHYAASGEELIHKVMALWNYTTRSELAGRRPLELYLRDIILKGAKYFDDQEDGFDPSTMHYFCNDSAAMLTKPTFYLFDFFAFVESGRQNRDSQLRRSKAHRPNSNDE